LFQEVFVLEMTAAFNAKYIYKIPKIFRNRDSAVGIAIGYGLDDRGVGVRVPVGSNIFSPPRRADRLCGPPNLMYNGYRELFPRV
jgi:hypothetical protein